MEEILKIAQEIVKQNKEKTKENSLKNFVKVYDYNNLPYCVNLKMIVSYEIHSYNSICIYTVNSERIIRFADEKQLERFIIFLNNRLVFDVFE